MPFDFEISFPAKLRGLFSTVSFTDIIDIFIVAVILYKFFQMLKDTRAITLVKGVLFFLAVTAIASFSSLHVISWILQQTATVLMVALPIVFQPELRRTLEHLGQGGFFAKNSRLDENARTRDTTGEIVKATKAMAAEKLGALMVIEREMKLNDVSATGVHTDALVTSELIQNIFTKNRPLHDGAAIIRGNRLISAGCLLPLTENRELSTELGTRHRAAIGMSEQCDALIVVVSEETGTISIADNGQILRHLTGEKLEEFIRPIFSKPVNKGFINVGNFFEKWRSRQ